MHNNLAFSIEAANNPAPKEIEAVFAFQMRDCVCVCVSTLTCVMYWGVRRKCI